MEPDESFGAKVNKYNEYINMFALVIRPFLDL